MRTRLRWCTAAVFGAAIGWIVVQAPGRALQLRASAAAPGQVRIEWDGDSSPARRASGAVLEIEDGSATYRRALTSDIFRRSSFTYAQRTGAVRIRLRVREADGAVVEQAVQFAGTPSAEPTRYLEVASTAPPVATLVERPMEPPPVPAPRAGISDRVEAPPVQQQPPPQDAPPAVHPFVMREMPAPQQAPAQIAMLGAPPVDASMPHLPSTQLLPIAPPKPQLYAGPRAGRLIWTGSLGRRGVVEIEGGHASVGELAGSLPGVPVKVRVQPAEFGPGGLMVYTGDAGTNGHVEQASDRNGWNAAQFEWNPQRASELVVLEAPNASNDFRRLALRSDARRCTVIVVDWSVP